MGKNEIFFAGMVYVCLRYGHWESGNGLVECVLILEYELHLVFTLTELWHVVLAALFCVRLIFLNAL